MLIESAMVQTLILLHAMAMSATTMSGTTTITTLFSLIFLTNITIYPEYFGNAQYFKTKLSHIACHMPITSLLEFQAKIFIQLPEIFATKLKFSWLALNVFS